MRIEDLTIFIDVVRYHSMSIASEKHFTTPQNVSKIIRSMENELGVELLKRSKKGSELTQAGEQFYLSVIKIVADYESAITKIQNNVEIIEDEDSPKEQIKLKVFCNQGAMNYAILHAYQVMQKENKYDAFLDLDVVNTIDIEDIVNKIENIDSDIIGLTVAEEDIKTVYEKCKGFIPMYTVQDEILLVCSANNPISKRVRISISEMSDLNLLVVKNCIFKDELRCSKTECRMSVDSLSTILRMVESSDNFCALVSENFVTINKLMNKKTTLCKIPLEEKLYRVHIVLIRENVLQEVWVQDFVGKFMKNILPSELL